MDVIGIVAQNTAHAFLSHPVTGKRKFNSLASGQIMARAPGLRREPGCEVELTEIRTRGQDWWTLGFETPGPADLLRSELEATAGLVFDQGLRGGAEPGLDDSRSYAEWLGSGQAPEVTTAPEDHPWVAGA